MTLHIFLELHLVWVVDEMLYIDAYQNFSRFTTYTLTQRPLIDA